MKKTKKILLWSIVPILGASGVVAGVVAGTATNSTTIVNTNTTEDSVSGNNSASSSVESNTTNDSNSSASTGTSASSGTTTSSSGSNTTTSTSTSTTKLTITEQSYDVLTYSGESCDLYIIVGGQNELSYLKYKWYVNKNDGNNWVLYNSGRNKLGIDIPTTSSLLNWTFRCQISDQTTGWKATSADIKLTIAPRDGRYIKVSEQPTSSLTVNGGQEVTLKTTATAIGSYSGKSIGYQWFEYDSEKNTFSKINGATSSTYTFTAPYLDTQTVKKYVCRYYFTSNPNVYLSDSNQSILTINKAEKDTLTIESLSATSYSIKSGESTTLSVKAKSAQSKSLSYQWYVTGDDYTFQKIDGATSTSYTYKAESVEKAKKLTFMVLVKGDQYSLQSNNLVVQVNPISESTDVETPTNELKIETNVIQNQAPVNDKFVSWAAINSYWYSVKVTSGVSENDTITYQWYYAGSDGIEHKISNATESTLTPNTELFKNIYENNNSHRAQLICKVYKNNKLSNVVNQSTNYKFYMTVGIVTRVQ